MDGTNALALSNPPGNEQIHHPAPDIGNESTPRGHEGISSSSVPLPQPAQLQATSPLEMGEERPPTLTEVNPDFGPITGGVRIWLKGMDFPALSPLFARFGTAVVPTVSVCFYLPDFISYLLLDFLFFEPSCLLFAS